MWDLNRLSKREVYDIITLLYNPQMQQDIYINYTHPYRKYMPFLDQMELQAKFLGMYGHIINSLDPYSYKKQIIIV